MARREGRPTKLTPAMQTQIVNLLRLGNYVETVCDYVGLEKSTFYRWMDRGERAWKNIDDDFVEFCTAVKGAMTLAEMEALRDLKMGPTNWQAKAWFLERRYPDKWGNRQKHVVSGPGDRPVEIKHTVELSDEQRVARIDALIARAMERMTEDLVDSVVDPDPEP